MELKCHERGKTCIDSHSQDRLPKRSNGLSLTFVGGKVICCNVWDGKDGGSGKDKVINHARVCLHNTLYNKISSITHYNISV